MGDHLNETSGVMIDANAAIRELADVVGPPHRDGLWDFICECDDDDCLERVPLSADEYDALRACGEPVLALGHRLVPTS